jgi:hypothetical protein
MAWMGCRGWWGLRSSTVAQRGLKSLDSCFCFVRSVSMESQDAIVDALL